MKEDKKNALPNQELNDEELDKVAGGIADYLGQRDVFHGRVGLKKPLVLDVNLDVHDRGFSRSMRMTAPTASISVAITR